MGKKKRASSKINTRRKGGFKYAPSRPLVSADDIKTIVKQPLVEDYSNRNISNNDRIVIVNGVVCTTGRYSRLYEDYDDS